MRRFFAAVVVTVALPACAAGGVTVFDEAAKFLAAGETGKAAMVLLAYGRTAPAGELANQALDCTYLIQKKNIPASAMVPYVEALALLASGYGGTADAAFRELVDRGDLPWAIRGRAALVVAELNTEGDRLKVLAAAWRACDDETARLLGIALADAYYKDGDVEAARGVRAEFQKRFPNDQALKYLDYLSDAEIKRK